REAVCPLPLLPDDLYLERLCVRRRVGLGDRVRTLTATGAIGKHPHGPVSREEQHDDTGDEYPRDLDPRVATHGWPLERGLRLTLAEGNDGVEEEHEHGERDRCRDPEQDGVVGDLPARLYGAIAGREARGEHEHDDRREHKTAHEPDERDAAPVVR